ncbi:MAG: dipeptidase PepE [Phycisphaerales bacterium]|nr:dipeptidase PepE [Phycisphaerales bacterium]
MRLLLGSGGFRTDERVALLAAQMRDHFGDVAKILFVPYALADHDGYVQMMTERGLNAGYALDGIHTHADPAAAVERAEALYVGGGNTFRLVDELHRRDLLEPIRARVRAGMPYMGVSAGSNVACPTLKTTNDMPIVMPPSFETLGLVPFHNNPHYFCGTNFVKRDDDLHEHFGETRDDRLREFHEMNDTPVVGLWEGGILRVDAGRIRLIGAPARVFRRGHQPVDIDPPADLSAHLSAAAQGPGNAI